MKRLFLLTLLAVALAGPAGCSRNLATGQLQFNAMPESQEIALGQQAAPQFVAENGGEIPSPRIQQYTRDLGGRLAAVSERPQLPWEFYVLDSEVINAFALPGGKVFLSRGLISKMTNEAQFVGVLGHEVGHVTAEHIGQQMTRALGLQAVATGLGMWGQHSDNAYLQVLGLGTQLGGGLYLLSFGRNQENQADELGLRYMTRIGYSPLGQLQVMEILKGASEGRGHPPQFLSTHPLPESRIKRIEEIIAREYPRADDPSRYTFGEESFRTNVLEELRRLPPPRHTAEQAQQQAQQLRAAGRAHRR